MEQSAQQSAPQIIENEILIRASATTVERCFSELDLMHRWLNPALRCEPVGPWSTAVGSRCRFVIQVPLLRPTLMSVVAERGPGLIVWQFDGFFEGRDRWACFPQADATLLVNRFEFCIPNALVSAGFNWFAADWTNQDMQAQLRRLKRVAEDLQQRSVGC